MVAPDRLFKIYISPLSALQLDEANTLRTTDHRLLRRMCRDYLFRGYPASRTLAVWSKVRVGENACIFPYQDRVDFVMNSAMEYELRVRWTLARVCVRAWLCSRESARLCCALRRAATEWPRASANAVWRRMGRGQLRKATLTTAAPHAPTARPARAQVLKVYAEPLLSAVLPDEPTFAKAQELLELLAHVSTASSSTVSRPHVRRGGGATAPRERRASSQSVALSAQSVRACRRCRRRRFCASSSATAPLIVTERGPACTYLGGVRMGDKHEDGGA